MTTKDFKDPIYSVENTVSGTMLGEVKQGSDQDFFLILPVSSILLSTLLTLSQRFTSYSAASQVSLVICQYTF